MKILFDLLPIILFFVAFKLYDIYIATAVAIAASVLQVLWLWLRHRKVEKMPLITTALLVVMGGLTIYLQDERFIKWKPTVINWLFAGVFFASHWFGDKNICQRMMAKQVDLPDIVWQRLNSAWVIFFLLSGLLNIIVAYQFSLDFWVNFKLFGLMGLTLIFIIGQTVYISRYLKQTAN